MVADVFGRGNPIPDMTEMLGYTTFGIEHAIFELVLGLVLTPRDEHAGGLSTAIASASV